MFNCPVDKLYNFFFIYIMHILHVENYSAKCEFIHNPWTEEMNKVQLKLKRNFIHKF